MIDPQEIFTDPATDGEEINARAPGLDDGQRLSAASDWSITRQSAQRAQRRSSADLRSSSVCW
jgi:hypothetical protein